MLFLNKRFKYFCVCSPKQKYNGVSSFTQFFGNRFCKLFPPHIFMWIGFALFNRKASVKKQNTLFCPTSKIATFIRFYAKFIFDFFEDIYKWWRRFYSVLHRKSKSMCLIWLVIWILSKNHHFYILKFYKIECIKNVITFGINDFLVVFLGQKFLKRQKIWFFKLIRK